MKTPDDFSLHADYDSIMMIQIKGSSTNRVGNHVHTGVVSAPRDYTL